MRTLAMLSVALLAACLAGVRPVRAQLFGTPAPDPKTGAQIGRSSTPPINAAKDVSLDQKLNAQVSMDTPFRDEYGRTVPLGSFFGNKPVILVLPFYKCPGMCTAELDGMVKVFQDEHFKYKVGKEFDVVTVSINPKEGPDIAATKKREYMNLLSQPGAGDGWHFLTGPVSSIQKLTHEIGYRYVFDTKTDQYAHPAGLILLTPSGKVSKYFYGIDYSPKDLRLALTEAGEGKVGSLVDKFVLYCYHYDPARNAYGLAIFRIVQIAGCSTVLLMGTFMFLAFRKDYREQRAYRAASAPAPAEKKA